MAELFGLICDISGIQQRELLDTKKCQKREYVIPRQVHMAVLHTVFDLSLADSGYIYEKNHSTVLHSLNTVNDLLEVDMEFRNKYIKVWQFCLKQNKFSIKKLNLNWL